ncbi:MAG: riboflavin synthase [Treponema sp.]|nr:riboflavin synthase [Treponema sp.]
MFTGLIEELGTIRGVKQRDESMAVTIGCRTVLEGLRCGDSVAVNGICLTATAIGSSEFVADVMPETFRRTTLRLLHRGETVNLERAMRADGRFGGHVVSGHIDGTGVIQHVAEYGNAFLYRVRVGLDILAGIVPKGSVAVDGISLTVVSVEAADHADGCFTVSVIPHTRRQTILAEKRRGSPVNIECDVIGKYVRKYTAAFAAAGGRVESAAVPHAVHYG